MSAPLRLLSALGRRPISRVFLDHHVLPAQYAAAGCIRPSLPTVSDNLSSQPHLVVQVRNVSFFNKVVGVSLWEGVVGVSNQGKKRGRGKRVGKKRLVDLNKGQILGTGKANILWPGLNAPIMKGREVLKRKQLPPNPDAQQQLVKLRDEQSRVRYPRLEPLLRGYSGKRIPGQSVGPPDPVADYTFDDFDSRVLEFKVVANMTGTLGRKHRFTAFVAVGNKNGLAGFGQGKAMNGRAAIRVAKNRAAQRLFYIERYQNHTGYGLRCHRVLRSVCELLGITNLHVKVEGSTKNIKAVVKGFFEALTQQETHQQLADRTGYHIVEIRPDRGNFPECIASPSHGIVRDKPLQDEEEDLDIAFERLYYKGKTEYDKPPTKPFYHKQTSYHTKRRVVTKRRNQPEAALLRRAGLW